ncbi:MAG: nucleotidyl transferase AbiEii/AbiGii toxin family protein [Acidobacteriota bacterium]|nr:nucleotidyl transferase AbiEii/AbiGii toxin family protein [Acidobacteriota bacterium]
MAEYDLPEGPAGLFEAVHEPLAAHLGGERHVRLGGGTALAMRWAHRHSTDVDLFTDGAPYARLYERRASLERDLKRRGIPLTAARIRPRNLKILLQDSEVTLFSGGPMLPGLPSSGDTVRGTGVQLEATAEIQEAGRAHARHPAAAS